MAQKSCNQRSKKGLERVDTMTMFSRHTDRERIKAKQISSPDLNRMPIKAINKKLRSTTYFHNATQFARWKSEVENLADYEIKINKSLLNEKSENRKSKRA